MTEFSKPGEPKSVPLSLELYTHKRIITCGKRDIKGIISL